MKILFYTFLSILILSSCGKDTELNITTEQEVELSRLFTQFDRMSSDESEAIREKLVDFYEVATVNNCEIGNFGIVTPEEVIEYLNEIGMGSPREFHDWTVNVGILLQELIDQNSDCEEDEVLSNFTAGQYANLSRVTSPCDQQSFINFSKSSLSIAGSFGVYIAGSGFRQINEGQLFAFGGAFNSFIRAQDLQDTCVSALPQ